MPICLLCRSTLPSLVVQEHQMTVAARCPQCHQVADKYIEQDNVTLWLDLMLLHGQAWTHCVFNTERRLLRKTVLVVLLVGFLLDAYVVTVMSTLVTREAEMEHIIRDGGSGSTSFITGQSATINVRAASSTSTTNGDPMSVVKSNGLPTTQSGVVLSLRIVDVARSGILQLEPVLALTGYAAWEFAMVGLCIVWATSAMGLGLCQSNNCSKEKRSEEKEKNKLLEEAKKDERQKPIRTAIRGMCLLAGPKLLYLLFLIWELPLYLLALVEFTAILTTFMCGRALLGPQTSISRPMFITAVSVGARTVFRVVTRWAPPTILMCGPAYISLLVET